MTPNKYATLRGTIARAKRNDCQKVVMRVTLVEELLLELSNAEKQIAELATENAWLKQFPDQIVGFIGKLGSSEIGSETKEKLRPQRRKSKPQPPTLSRLKLLPTLSNPRLTIVRSASIGTASWIRTASVMKMLHSVKRVQWRCTMRYFARSAPYEFRHHRSGKRAGRAPPAAGHTKTPYRSECSLCRSLF